MQYHQLSADQAFEHLMAGYQVFLVSIAACMARGNATGVCCTCQAMRIPFL